jgi:HEAT repeat protein
VRQFKGSNYFPDALADLAQIEAQLRVRVPRAVEQASPEGEESSYFYEATAPPAIRNLEKRLHIMAERLPRLMIAPSSVTIRLNDTTIERTVRIRMQAIAALSETKEDEKSFQTLRTIAADTKQPPPVRIVAMNSLAGLRKHNVLPVFVEIARSDTSRAMTVSAISMICVAGHDRDRKVQSLEEVFQSLPPDREQLLSSTLYAIAEVGNDRAVDFLGRVATTHASDNLRGDAIFFLGNIGTEKARAALFQILQGEGR